MIYQGITSAECREARAFLGWSCEDLSVYADIAEHIIANFEKEIHTPTLPTSIALRHAFEKLGNIAFGNTIRTSTKLRGITPGPKMLGWWNEVVEAGENRQ